VEKPEPFLTDWPLVLRNVLVEILGINCRIDLAVVLAVPEARRVRYFEFGTRCKLDDASVQALVAFASVNSTPKVKFNWRLLVRHQKALTAAFGERATFAQES
jgi:hypothetical protein